MDGKVRVSPDFTVNVMQISPSIGGHTGHVTVFYDGCDHLHKEAIQIIEAAPKLIRALEDAGECLLKGYGERIGCLKRIKELYHEVTGWHFIADPNNVGAPTLPEALDTKEEKG